MRKWIGIAVFGGVLSLGSAIEAQRSVRKPPRAIPPKFPAGEFSGVFFPDPIAQLKGKPAALASATTDATNAATPSIANEIPVSGSGVWKQLISGQSIEDLVKESKSRLDGVITTPAKFAGGGYAESRREFTLLASLMAIISQYPDEIRWKNSSAIARTLFARMAANCKVGTQPVFNEAKLRQQDLQDLLKGSKIEGVAEDISWADTADRGPSMQILEWALRENLAPGVSSDDSFSDAQEELVKFAELVAAYGHVLQQEGMTDADDDIYLEFALGMVSAAAEVVKAAKNGDADSARSAVGRIDQSCNKCHEIYR